MSSFTPLSLSWSTWRRRGAALALSLFGLSSAHAAVTTQLGFLIDASGSIGATNFNLMRAGYAAAINALPDDGSIELTVYTFASGTAQVLPPTVVTAANRSSLATTVSNMTYTQGFTATADGIHAISNAMLNSSLFSTDLRTIINIATDGVPNVSNSTTLTAQEAAIAEATAAHAAGIDALTAEVIGGATADPGFMQDIVFSPLTGPCTNCGQVLPNGSTPSNPMTSTPWVLLVSDYNGFGTAINAKVQAIVNPTDVPEPGALALAGLGLALVAVRRRRA